MAKQLIIKDGRYYFVDEDTLDVIELCFDKQVLNPDDLKEILKIYIRENRG
jgi:hypothetical protein